MDRNAYSRREFLKTFALLSSTSLIAGLSPGCGFSENPFPPQAAYGPMPPENTTPEVAAIYYIDNQANRVLLPGNQSVPVQIVCRIDFSKAMNTTALITINFADSAGYAVPISKAWTTDQTLTLTPVSQLASDTVYSVSVGSDAQDIYGNAIQLTAAAAASFRTVSG